MMTKHVSVKTTHSDDSSENKNTWLWFDLAGTKRYKFRWCCLACADQGDLETSFHESSPQLSNLLAHQDSVNHKKFTAALLGRPELADPEKLYCNFSPAENIFKELLEAVVKGEPINKSVVLPSGVISHIKAFRMLWCMNEAEIQDVMDHLLNAVVMMIARDERHSRMHVRFRSADEKGELRAGFLGQSRDHDPNAIGITQAPPMQTTQPRSLLGISQEFPTVILRVLKNY